MSKTITQELIEQKLEEKGWKLTHGEDMTYDKMSEKVLEHYNVEFTDMYNNNCGYYIYTESTRDGYEVWVAAENMSNVCISEDVYYYDSDIHEALVVLAMVDASSPQAMGRLEYGFGPCMFKIKSRIFLSPLTSLFTLFILH